MRKTVFGIIAVALCALVLSSCKKDKAADYLGTYHFKMSGTFTAQKSDGTKTDFVLSSQFGTMTIVHGQNDGYFVNMSVMMGDVMAFNASLKDGYLELDPHTIVVSIKEDGSGNTSTSVFANDSKDVSLSLQGQAGRYDNTLMFRMSCSGDFVYGENAEKYTVVADSCDIVCVATDL